MSEDDERLVFWKEGGNFEILADGGYRYEHGGYVIDGYFLVKSGGMHQGVISYALSEVEEAQVLLTPSVEIRAVELK